MSACYRATAKLGPDLVSELRARQGAGAIIGVVFQLWIIPSRYVMM